jgi:hypothetical protein
VYAFSVKHVLSIWILISVVHMPVLQVQAWPWVISHFSLHDVHYCRRLIDTTLLLRCGKD